MRRMLRVLGWMGMGLSALLLVASVVLWVRSLGHGENWEFRSFQPNPEWKMGPLAGQGTSRGWFVGLIHGRFLLGAATLTPCPEMKFTTEHRRSTITADKAREAFELDMQPGERAWLGGIERVWRFAGVGFKHSCSAIAPETGHPRLNGFSCVIPFYLLALLFALWPALFLLRRLFRRKRYAKGLCPTCGYDLRATPDRCPECGREVVRTGG